MLTVEGLKMKVRLGGESAGGLTGDSVRGQLGR